MSQFLYLFDLQGARYEKVFKIHQELLFRFHIRLCDLDDFHRFQRYSYPVQTSIKTQRIGKAKGVLSGAESEDPRGKGGTDEQYGVAGEICAGAVFDEKGVGGFICGGRAIRHTFFWL
jgi:hypothetical protein